MGEFGLDIKDVFITFFREGVTKAIALEKAIKEELLLRWSSQERNQLDEREMVLWNLTEAGISRR